MTSQTSSRSYPREAGILLHLTSLPGPGGVGDLGPEAHALIEWLARAGQSVWQVLPIGPTGYGDSPYQLFSCMAGNPLLVNLEALVPLGLLEREELSHAPPSHALADYGAAIHHRLPLLSKAAYRLRNEPSRVVEGLRSDFDAFCQNEAGWLDDFALFMALKQEHGGAPWHTWAPPLRDRQKDALAAARQRLWDVYEMHRFAQFQFFAQFTALREHARRRGIELVGDMPIFVAHDSVEVWVRRDLFLLNEDGSLRVQAGVPPDYFSKTGQLWGNPLYNWERIQEEGFAFWRARIKQALRLFDRVRIDHFRGFCAHWEIPGGAPTAEQGRWVNAPGHALFAALSAGGPLPLIAEDLGVITPDVDELRDHFGLPGMRVLQFAFGPGQMPGELTDMRPFGYRHNLVVYTSTHDNDTFVGWFGSGWDGGDRGIPGARSDQRNFLDYVGLSAEEADRVGVHRAAIRLAYATAARLVIVPIQDVLGLGPSARMNCPGEARGNWGFRLLPGQLDESHGRFLLGLGAIYGRLQTTLGSESFL